MYNCFSKLLVGDIIILHHDPKRRQVQHVKQSWNDYKESNDVGNFQPVSVPGAKRQKWTKTVRKLCLFEPSTAACFHIYDTRGNKLHFPFTGLIQTLLSTNPFLSPPQGAAIVVRSQTTAPLSSPSDCRAPSLHESFFKTPEKQFLRSKNSELQPDRENLQQ